MYFVLDQERQIVGSWIAWRDKKGELIGDTGVNAQFSIETGQLAFPIRSEMGEVDCFVVYPNLDIEVLKKLNLKLPMLKRFNNYKKKI